MKALKTVRNSVKNWYILLIVGLIFLAGGIYSFISPVGSFLALALFFGYSLLISGAIEIVFSITNREELQNWGWTLIFGFITFLVGLLLLALFITRPHQMAHPGTGGAEHTLALGILGVLFSFLLLWNPAFAGVTIAFWIGMTLTAAGLFSIYLSLKLRKLKGLPEKISKELTDRFQKVQEEIRKELGK